MNIKSVASPEFRELVRLNEEFKKSNEEFKKANEEFKKALQALQDEAKRNFEAWMRAELVVSKLLKLPIG